MWFIKSQLNFYFILNWRSPKKKRVEKKQETACAFVCVFVYMWHCWWFKSDLAIFFHSFYLHTSSIWFFLGGTEEGGSEAGSTVADEVSVNSAVLIEIWIACNLIVWPSLLYLISFFFFIPMFANSDLFILLFQRIIIFHALCITIQRFFFILVSSMAAHKTFYSKRGGKNVKFMMDERGGAENKSGKMPLKTFEIDKIYTWHVTPESHHIRVHVPWNKKHYCISCT